MTNRLIKRTLVFWTKLPAGLIIIYSLIHSIAEFPINGSPKVFFLILGICVKQSVLFFPGNLNLNFEP